MSDQLFDGRRIRVLTIVDNFSRVNPLIGVDLSYKGCDVVEALSTAVKRYGLPERIQVDNGPEFISKDVDIGPMQTKWFWIFLGRESPRITRLSNRSTVAFGMNA